MISRLLRQLGMDLSWVDAKDTALVKRTMGSLGGVFYVGDASTEVDGKGRKVIAAQDFVAAQGVRAVFGFGGAYLGLPTFYVTILFARESIPSPVAEQFAAAMSTFKMETIDLVRRGVLAP